MSSRRFKRDDWLTLGLAELSAKGPEAVKLEAVCEAAGRTRGSFYHHFDDHDAFVVGLANRWFETQTVDVAKSMDAHEGVVERGHTLTDAAIEIDYRLELGIRELGRRLPPVGEIVRQADQFRLDVLTTLYRDRYDLDDAKARSFAFLEYAAFSGFILLDPDIAADRQHELAALYEKTIHIALSGEVS